MEFEEEEDGLDGVVVPDAADDSAVRDGGFRKSLAEREVAVAPEEPPEVAAKIRGALSYVADGCELR